MYGVRFLALLVLLVVLNSFVNGDESPLNPIAAAAERTEEQPGARFTMTALYTGAGLPQPMVAHGVGASNSEAGLSRAVLRLNEPCAGRITTETIGDGTSIYMRGTMLSSELPDGKEW